jgi:hypothetical protein
MFVASCSSRRSRWRTNLVRATRSAAWTCATLLPALALLGWSGLAAAQTTPDPITGNWSGRVGPSVEPNYAIKLDLRLAGTSVGGTVSSSDGTGEVRGTYDAPSGTLHLTVTRLGDQRAPFVFDGVAVQGIATGRASSGQTAGTFVFMRNGASARDADANIASIDRSQLRTAFEELNANIAKAAELVPASRFGWRPVGTVRTLGQVVGHIADAYYYYCGRAAGHPVQWSDAIAESQLDKPTLMRKLNDAAAQCTAAHGAGSVGPLIVNYGHANLHYGNLVTYLRVLGLVPPTSG